MRWSDIPFRPPPSTLRQFAGLWLAVFGALACWHGLVRHHPTAAAILSFAAVAVGAVGLARPAWIRLVFVTALVVTFPLGWTMSQVLLATLYYGILTPLGLFFRIIGRDPLELERPRGRDSYWTPKPAPESLRQYFRQY